MENKDFLSINQTGLLRASQRRVDSFYKACLVRTGLLRASL